ncbi:TetR/AcrR family transcriptional regulator [Aeromicrobium alkaliterrae]|uniref:TetR/AcrR family transcriptional regulator n=1 Tax=Aeromicrobium alkaliterrae TaxID=302168 RepID=A0ABN2K6Z3_9ACTN
MAVQAKDRLLLSAIKLGQRDGWSRLTVADVLQDSGVARRSLYTHFPGGAKEITVAAVETAADWITAVVERACQEPSATALATFVEHWKHVLESSDFELGCPVAAAATSRPQHPEAAALAAHAFTEWESQITAALVRDGAGPDAARRLGTVSVACVEGAVIQCVAARSCVPLEIIHDHLQSVIVTALA